MYVYCCCDCLQCSGAQGGPPTQRFYLNNKPLFTNGWLDMGYWPDGIYTAPSDDAILFDLQSVKRYGFNMIRVQEKVHNERWYYHADTLGVLVWQDAPQKYSGATADTVPLFTNDLNAMVLGKINHPRSFSISSICHNLTLACHWDIFNEDECWQVFSNVDDVVNEISALDSTRLINSDSGGSANAFGFGNVNDIYSLPSPIDNLPSDVQYAVLGNYGGLGYFVTGKEWVNNACTANKVVDSTQQLLTTYSSYLNQLMLWKGDLSGVVYVRMADTELQCNGFMTYDRTDKLNSTQIDQIQILNQKLISSMS
ncbi:hypothetical protein RFI_08379 [Reticulomyxa filosa]|uniref:Uncharacterized protein n=1 Tax=Reticulomyxa filosa TaxID=46433 RepID=X6NRV6_RETFI|nr:hypothetical protein RFI_08379 [Reticulomyxa filosa]|eukprot:ETO28751.1 hypothetical protein RFI_08379 [Reticulomyxa filosa]